MSDLAGDQPSPEEQLHRSQIKLQKDQLDFETRLQKKRLAFEKQCHADELKLKTEEASRSKWPVAIPVITALIVLLSGVFVSCSQGQSNLELEREQFQSNLVLKAIETGQPEKAAKNLIFLARTGYLHDPGGMIQSLETEPANAPVLPVPQPGGPPSILKTQADYDYLHGRSSDAITRLLQTLHVEERSFGIDSVRVADTLSQLGLAYRDLGRHAEAAAIMRRVLEIRVARHLQFDAARAANNLALIYRDLGRFTEAKEYYEQARKVTSLPEYQNDVENAWTLLGLGIIAAQQSDYPAAKRFIRSALEVRGLQEYPSDYAWMCYNLAGVYQRWRKSHDAEPYISKAVDYWRGNQAARPDLIDALNKYAEVLQSLGKKREAEGALAEAHNRSHQLAVEIAASGGVLNPLYIGEDMSSAWPK